MTGAPLLQLVLDLVGTFAFALDGALTAMRAARLDVVGVLTLALVTALGGGVIRDVLGNSLPPATFSDWRYLAVAVGGGLVAFVLGGRLERYQMVITVLDAVGLSVFAVSGAAKALHLGLGPVQAALLGAVTGVGGGTLRDLLVLRVPTVLRADLYAIPALFGAALTVLFARTGVYGGTAASGAAAACFLLRMVGVRYGLNAPGPREAARDEGGRGPGGGGRSRGGTVGGDRAGGGDGGDPDGAGGGDRAGGGDGGDPDGAGGGDRAGGGDGGPGP